MQWRLPDRLVEISALALNAEERLFAITDEVGVIYELDYVDGGLVKSFTVGDPPLRADFEGIAVLGDTIWLMTSDGSLYATTEADDGETSPLRQSFRTDYGDYCELEGLAADRSAGTLLLACKETADRDDALKVFEVEAPVQFPASGDLPLVREVELPEDEITEWIGEKHVNPSAIVVDPANGDWLFVAARQRAFVRLGPDGTLSEAIILQKKERHRQAEGIEMTRDGRLLIADEGGDGKARLAVYRTEQEATGADEE